MSRTLYHQDLVPRDIRQILNEISRVFAKQVSIDGIEGEWIHFHIPGWTDKMAAIRLEMAKDKVFGKRAADFEIYCPQNTPEGRGLWIRSMADRSGKRRNGSISGVWFY